MTVLGTVLGVTAVFPEHDTSEPSPVAPVLRETVRMFGSARSA